MHQTHNTLDLLARETSITVLNRHLAAAIDLAAQLKQAHWNVRGPSFLSVHRLFDEVATEIAADADALAERCAALGGTASGTIQTAVQASFLVPYHLAIADTQQHVFATAAALAAFGQSVRNAIQALAKAGDAATADLFTQIARSTDRHLWLIESHAAPRA